MLLCLSLSEYNNTIIQSLNISVFKAKELSERSKNSFSLVKNIYWNLTLPGLNRSSLS
jgi:hypothetical protein